MGYCKFWKLINMKMNSNDGNNGCPYCSHLITIFATTWMDCYPLMFCYGSGFIESNLIKYNITKKNVATSKKSR